MSPESVSPGSPKRSRRGLALAGIIGCVVVVLVVVNGVWTRNSSEARLKETTEASAVPFVAVIKAGTGTVSPKPDDNVTVTYKGSLIDGKVFDQTQAGQTATFPAGQLIPGWVEALQLMKEGDSWELVIPANLGYGAEGAGGVIPPNQTLIFQMELRKVDVAAPPPP